MADVVHVAAPDFTQAAATIAQHLETAAAPPHAVAPPPVASSPVDLAASGAAGAIQTKIASLSAQLAPKGPAIQQAVASAAGSLTTQDAANAARMPSEPSVPSPTITRVHAVDNKWKQGPGQQPSMSREQAKAGLEDVNRKIWAHNHIDKPVIETLPPNDPRRTDFHIETEQLNAEKQRYLDALFRDRPPESIVGPHDEHLPGVSPGRSTLGPTDNGKGWTFPIQQGQAGIDPRVANVRVMEPTPQYPDGYAVYMNKLGQTVNPFTGQTIPPSDPFAHIPLMDQ